MGPLLHIGYHKTGSTWLQKRIFVGEPAGLGSVGGPEVLNRMFVTVNAFAFDPAEVTKELEADLRSAEERGLVPVLSLERFSGNPHSGGYDSRVICDRLASVFPDARVVVVLREEREMILSLYKQYVGRGGAAPLRLYLDAPPGAHRRVPSFRFDFLEYHRLIGYYQSVFGRENVLVLPYELLKADAGKFLMRLGSFAGFTASVAGNGPINVSSSALALAFKRYANRYLVRDALNPAPPLGGLPGANRALARRLPKLDAVLPQTLKWTLETRWRHEIDSALGVDTLVRYATSNDETSRITGMELSGWGYVSLARL